MLGSRRRRRPQAGQALVLFVLTLTFVLIPAVGLVIDGGYALAQNRASQNSSDFAALAGARVIAEWINGDSINGTDANVQAAITASIRTNGGTPLVFDDPVNHPSGPRYINANGGFACVDASGASTVCTSANAGSSYVGNGAIPTGAVGVLVNTSRSWTAFFHGLFVPDTWAASTTATAKGGYAAGGPGGDVFPAGIAEAFFNGRTTCSGSISTDPTSPCYPQHLTPGNLNVPGGFGWLKFGCDGFGLGQSSTFYGGSPAGCQNNKPFLQTEIGPPSKSFGCCTQVGLPGSADLIGSLPGNKASADCSYYIDNKVIVIVPVWDYAGGQGSNAYYHIVGFTGFQLTACDGGKDIEGVWRQPFFLGPTTTTPGFAGAPLAVQLVN